MTRISVRHASATSVLAIAMAALLVTVSGTAAHAAAATAVPLGTADSFAVLAASGITNSGVTTITGDSGSNPTPAESGWASVVQSGANHPTADGVTGGAMADLGIAYRNAAGQTPSTIGTELGSQTLGAGVYDSADGTFGMTGTLTLDGANDANSVFIFQTATTLTTAVSANVVLERGAQACNVFWQIGSSAALGATSNLVGTVMASASISLDSGVTVIGRLLAGEQGTTGAVTLLSDTIIRPACAARVIPPVVTVTATASATPSTAAASASASAAAASKSAAAVKAAAASKSAAAVKAAAAAAAGGGLEAAGAPGAPQIRRVPVGAVHTGDGSSIPRAGNVPQGVIAGFGMVGFIAAGLGVGASAAAHRRRREH